MFITSILIVQIYTNLCLYFCVFLLLSLHTLLCDLRGAAASGAGAVAVDPPGAGAGDPFTWLLDHEKTVTGPGDIPGARGPGGCAEIAEKFKKKYLCFNSPDS